MGSNKQEKRVRKMSATTDLVLSQRGRSKKARKSKKDNLSSSEEYKTMQEEEVQPNGTRQNSTVEGKSKKARKSKKGNLSSSEEYKLMQGEELRPDKTHKNYVGEGKSKNTRRSKKRNLSSIEEYNLVKEEEVQPDETDQNSMGEGKSKKARKSKKGKLSLSEDYKLMQEEKVQPDKSHQNSTGDGKSKKARKLSQVEEAQPDKDHQISTGEGTTRKAGIKRVKDKRNKKRRSVSEDVDIEPTYQISSAEEDTCKGMRKWITEYRESRPGMEVLQQRIDDFMTAYEEQEQKARNEREAQAADGGWTVVVHRKGGKRTTDPESGVAVGSVAQAAVLDKMAKKKNKDVGLDFYRFQRREAQRSEIMKLQTQFEEDRKRIQQRRAERKFKPY